MDKFERCLHGKMTGNKLTGREGRKGGKKRRGGEKGRGRGRRERDNMNELERRQCLR